MLGVDEQYYRKKNLIAGLALVLYIRWCSKVGSNASISCAALGTRTRRRICWGEHSRVWKHSRLQMTSALKAQSNLAVVFPNPKKTDYPGDLIHTLQKSKNYSVGCQMTRLVHQGILDSVYTAQGEFVKAIHLRREVCTQLLATLGENHIQTLRALSNRKDDYFLRGHMNKAATLR